MSGIFDAIPNDVDNGSGVSVLPSDETSGESEKYIVLRRQEKILRKIRKVLKKQKKVMREMRQLIAERYSIEENEKHSTGRTKDNETQVFFRDLGKAVCKAVPAILTALATAAFNFFIGKKRNGRNGLQFT